MRRTLYIFLCILLAAGVLKLRAQVVSATTSRQISVTAGGMASIFQPDFAGNWTCGNTCKTIPSEIYPVAEAGNQPLFGAGAYLDVKFTRWVQVEAEARWQRMNQFAGIYQDNYLVGPRVPVLHFKQSSVYAKALAGYSRMDFDNFGSHGTFTDIAFGGGMDVKMTRRLSLRLVDVEYQYWPAWGNSTLSPYGASMGVGYRIF